MTTRTILLSCALALFSGVFAGTTPAAADEKAKVAPAAADLSGRWAYNRELSDDAREKMREAMEKGGGPGGGRPPGLDFGYFVEPTIFADVPVESELWREEVFGPVLAVRTFREEEEAVRLANDSPYGLAAAVMSADLERCRRVARRFRAGIVWINCSQPTFSQAPWGGRKQSGIGRELGEWGLANYLEVKQVTTYESRDPWGWYLKP